MSGLHELTVFLLAEVVQAQAARTKSVGRPKDCRYDSGMIRTLELSDLPRLVELCAEHAAFEKASYDKLGKGERLEQAVFCDAPRLFVWVAVQENVVGYASMTLDFSTWDAAPFAYLDCLYLQPSARGGGMGQQLLEVVVAFARSKNCRNVQWQTPNWNVDAQRFYLRQGATQSSKERFILPLN
jgi:GNAT superfamily N-acetyltransferase